jgi:Xaa-Pro aminopeptidase
MIPIQAFSERRHRLASQMQKGVAIIPTAPERVRNRDAHYPYRFDSYFYYLTGFAEPEAVLVIVAGVDKDVSKSILFCREKNIEYEIWNGFRYGPEAAGRHSSSTRHIPLPSWTKCYPYCLPTSPAVFLRAG